MAEAAEAVRVDITNSLEGIPEEVQCALLGLAYVTGGLISVGEEGMVANEAQHINSLFDRINSGCNNAGVQAALARQHPAFEQLLVETERYTTDPTFAHYLGSLGFFDTSYTLKPDAANPKHFTLSIFGYD